MTSGTEGHLVVRRSPVAVASLEYASPFVIGIGVSCWAIVMEQRVAWDSIGRAGVCRVVTARAAIVTAPSGQTRRFASDGGSVVVCYREAGRTLGIDVDIATWGCASSVRRSDSNWEIEPIDKAEVIIVFASGYQSELGEGDRGNTWLGASQATNARTSFASLRVRSAEVAIPATPDSSGVPIVWDTETLCLVGIELVAAIAPDVNCLWVVRIRVHTGPDREGAIVVCRYQGRISVIGGECNCEKDGELEHDEQNELAVRDSLLWT